MLIGLTCADLISVWLLFDVNKNKGNVTTIAIERIIVVML